MRQRFVVLLVLIGCLASSAAHAGRLFGDVSMDGKPLPAGIPVMVFRVAEGGKATRVDSTATDKFGSYKLTVKDAGKCSLTIRYEKQNVTLEVFSYKEATRYDLILQKKEGKLGLRRK